MASQFPSHAEDGTSLSQPLRFEFSGKVAPNRVLKAAMTERLSTWDPDTKENRGIPTEAVVLVYKTWGLGSIGTILTGNIMLDYHQLEAAGNAIIPPHAPFHGERFEMFNALASAAKAHGSLILGQVSHPGRQVPMTLNADPVSASDIQLEGEVMGMKFAKPHPASLNEIKDIIARFTHAAEYLHRAGFDGIELHGAHGYLLSQFLSPTTNKRTDQYGGSLSNRARIVIEIAQSIRQTLPVSTGFVLGIKVNSVEFQDGGFSTGDAQELCSMLEQVEFDFVELSGGTYQSSGFVRRRETTRNREAFFLDFAEKISPELRKTKTYVTGGFKTVETMVKALIAVDGLGLGRPLCQEPDLVQKILNGNVSGAMVQKIDMDDFRHTNLIAGSQIRQIGQGHEPLDMSKEESVSLFMRAVTKWTQRMRSGNPWNYGYIDMKIDG